jgi:hypothetical protein
MREKWTSRDVSDTFATVADEKALQLHERRDNNG